MKTVFAILLSVHLLIHFIGFLRAFNMVEMPESTLPISRTQGIFWLLTGILFILPVILYMQNDPLWAIITIPLVFMSQVLLIMNWKDAKFGTIINLIIIAVAIVYVAGWQLQNS
ncbi:hypothetical protein [Gramella sp. KN1008]|uniref:hypothetical protein n=1 Tax=Gramella sp. KN1008 TaxID=2529298 RepID=UPI0010407E60|nr:hypothetical protein [Gramella sp. KN1008]TBW28001.1 hypothetical protein EZJ28_09720 [Gramella sp. KN1008]